MQSYDGSAARRVAGDRDSAMRAGDGLDDGEPQAGSSVVTGAAGIRAPEALERMRQETGREAGTMVADLDVKVRAAGLDGQHDDRAAGGEPQCVVQEVVDGLADPVRVDAGAQARGSIDLAGEAAGSEARAGPLRAAGEQRMQLGLLKAEAELIVVTAGE